MKDESNESIRAAIEVFVTGFAETKSRTWPYEVIRHGNLWQLRDRERKNANEYRKEEWIAFDVAPNVVHLTAQQAARDRYFICPVIATNDSIESIKSEYKSLGYRLLATEPLFEQNLKRIPRAGSAASIQLLKNEIQANDFAVANRIRPEKPEVYSRDEYRQYLAYVDNELVGWVRSIETEHGNWCSNLFVQPAFRRQGIAKSLLCQMLRDDRKRGASQNVLLSSKAGSLVYPRVGYAPLGTLLILAFRKES